MSDDQQIAFTANRPDDCSTEQPPKDDDAAAAACPVQPPKDDDAAAAACPVQPPKDDVAAAAAAACPVQFPNDDAFPVPLPNDDVEMSDVVLSSRDDEAACPAPPTMDGGGGLAPAPMDDDGGLAPAPMDDDGGLAPPPNNDAGPSSPSNVDAGSATPSMDDTAHPADATVALVPKAEPGCSNANGSADTDGNSTGVQIKQEIKHETIDLGNDTYFYDDNNKAILVKGPPKVGFDRGLEPDHIVGATEVDGKLMFLIAWKNSEIADLLESTVIYERCPQIAIKFFEARLRYCPNAKK